MNIFIGLKTSMRKEHQDSIYDRGEQGAHGNGQDPGPEQVDSDTPSDGGQPFRCSDAHDGARDGMRGTHGNAHFSVIKRVMAPAVSALTPSSGFTFVIRVPMVFTIFHPPLRVPNAIQVKLTRGTHILWSTN